MKNKNILIIVTGSIAAYKACEVVRLIRKEGINVQVMMSKSATNFIGKTTFAALSGNEVLTDLFSNSPKAGLDHINFSFSLDAIVVIPATANIICKAANGIADDIVSTTLSVCEQPTLFVPAMNFRMWQNPATMRAVSKLRNYGKTILDPDHGLLASLHEGEGRLVDNTSIMNGIRELFKISLPMKGKKVLVTAGPTIESIDPVRFISNRSSGKMGYSIAENARDMGADVTLISGPVSIQSIPGIDIQFVESANEMKKIVVKKAKIMDYIFMAAAVADFFPINISTKKIKRENNLKKITLKPSPDILISIKGKTDAIITAFALETHEGENEALRKLKEKDVDFIILNYANEKGAGFNCSTNRVTIFSRDLSKIELKKDRKDRIAKKIIQCILYKLEKNAYQPET